MYRVSGSVHRVFVYGVLRSVCRGLDFGFWILALGFRVLCFGGGGLCFGYRGLRSQGQ